ncbi:MAG: BolA family protein [Gammaproteobacteria bacterium]
MNTARIELMYKLLNEALAPESCEVIDEGHLHIGHEGARGGRGHYRIRIASPRFHGLSRIAQHRLVYDALAGLMADEIHAVCVEVVGE